MSLAFQKLSHLANLLATIEQLESSGSQLDGVPANLERSLIFAGARLTQLAGILLRLPQDIIAQTIVVFTRFWIGPEGGSLREYSVKDVSAGAVYLIAKASALPKSPRSIINAYGLIDSLQSAFVVNGCLPEHNDPDSYHVSDGTYHTRRVQLAKMESAILRVLGFQIHVALPHTLCINYLQTLEAMEDDSAVAKRAIAHLNTALLSPQSLYLTHQPTALATAAIYLAAREVGVKLPSNEWWEVFDVDREELGFLVVAMISMEGFVAQEKTQWGDSRIPLSVEEVNKELEHRSMTNGG